MARLVPAILLLVALAASPAAAQRCDVYCNITEITAEQLSNGVRITIQADGELHWYLDFASLIEEGAAEGEVTEHGIHIWGLTEKFRRLPFRINNARSKLGSGFVAIDKYPVSHAEIHIPEWAKEGVGLEVDIVNYLGWISGEGQSWRMRGDWDVESSEASDAIIVLWESDRFPAPEPPKTPEDLPEELQVTAEEGLLTLRAVNAKLQDVTNAIAREAGFSVSAPGDGDLRVSLCLRDVTPEKALNAIAAGCGLCAEARRDGGWIVARPTGSAAGYGASRSRRVHLRYLRALDAVDLLPNFLLEYLHPDEESNTVVVTGPESLLDRVEGDLAKLDIPAPQISVEVVAVEYSSGEDMARALKLERFATDFAAGLDSLTGGLSFLWLESLPDGWDLLLDNLEVQSSTRLRSSFRVRVLNSHEAAIGAGQQRFVILERGQGAFLETSLEPVWTNSFISVQPLVGDGDEVVFGLGVIIRSLRGTDPKTGLPIVSLRRANGALRVRDGETVVLAGLRLEEQDRRDRSLPGLGALPIVGGIFRAPARSHTETRLAFFLTPHIIRSSPAERGEANHAQTQTL